MQGLAMMKHTINHRYKFENYGLVCMSAFIQFAIALLCELLNFTYIIEQNNIMEIIN